MPYTRHRVTYIYCPMAYIRRLMLSDAVGSRPITILILNYTKLYFTLNLNLNLYSTLHSAKRFVGDIWNFAAGKNIILISVFLRHDLV